MVQELVEPPAVALLSVPPLAVPPLAVPQPFAQQKKFVEQEQAQEQAQAQAHLQEQKTRHQKLAVVQAPKAGCIKYCPQQTLPLLGQSRIGATAKLLSQSHL